MNLFVFRQKCLDCGTLCIRADWLPQFRCADCFAAAGRTDPYVVLGFWHGCLRQPDYALGGSDAYWDAYEAGMKRTGGRHIDLAVEVTKNFPSISPDEAVKKFTSQRRSAATRGIDWQFDICSWLRVWLESGHWAERGRSGFVMARNGDIGPYAPDNVYIATSSKNIKDGWVNKPASTRAARPVGYGRGWKFRAKSKTNPYEVSVAGRYVGMYPTKELAEEAYQRAASSRGLQ